MVLLKYIIRGIYRRKTSTFAALGGSALVVLVFAAALMIPNAINRMANGSKHADLAIVLSRGASTETESFLEEEAARAALGAKEIAIGADGQPAAAAEVVTTVLMEKLGVSGPTHVREVLVRVRGLTARSLSLRPEVKLIAGRLPTLGTTEAMVGQAVHGHFKGLAVGQSFEAKRGQPLTVVGVFAAGSTDDNEVFVDANVLREAIGREGLYSSVRAKVPSGRFDVYKAAIESQQRLGAEVLHESEFVAAQFGPQAGMMQGLGTLVSLFFGLGGIIGALITMHSAVANRTRELGTLRALGFTSSTVLFCVIVESMVITTVGGLVGVVLALGLSRVEISMINVMTMSEMIFRLQPDPQLIVGALIFAVMLGLIGGLGPAITAARVRPSEALRK